MNMLLMKTYGLTLLHRSIKEAMASTGKGGAIDWHIEIVLQSDHIQCIHHTCNHIVNVLITRKFNNKVLENIPLSQLYIFT